MCREVEIQSVCPGVHQLAQPGGAGSILRLEFGWIDVDALTQILPDRAFALGLGGPAERGQIIGLDAREIVFCLRIDCAEHCVSVASTADMRNAPVITRDRHPGSFSAPARHVGGGLCDGQ